MYSLINKVAGTNCQKISRIRMNTFVSRTNSLTAVLIATFISFATPALRANEEPNTFEKLRAKPWKQTFSDQSTGKWQDQWFLDGDPKKNEILVIPKGGNPWTATYKGNLESKNWSTPPLTIPGSETRKKMDNAWLGDLDSDGDLDVMTTDENGGWGVVWFENPARSKHHEKE